MARQRAEVQAVRQSLAVARGNLSRAAELLGVTRPTLYDLLGKHSIDAAQFGKSGAHAAESRRGSAAAPEEAPERCKRASLALLELLRRQLMPRRAACRSRCGCACARRAAWLTLPPVICRICDR